MSEDRPTSSEEMIRRAREELMVSAPESEVAAEAPRVFEADPVDVDIEPVLEVREPIRPAPPARPGRTAPPPPSRPQRRMPAPVATPPTGPVDVGRRARRGVPWAVILVVLFFVGSFLSLGDEESAPVVTTHAVATPGSPSEVAFRDDFDGDLAPGWTWISEVSDRWSLTDRSGMLRISAPTLLFPSSSPRPQNLLLRIPDGDSYEVTTRMEFVPTSNFQGAGIIVYQTQFHYLMLNRAFCRACPGGDGVYLDNVTGGGVPESDGGHRIVGSPSTVFLRLTVNGDTFSGSYSVDGKTWRSAGTVTKPMVAPFIGVVVRQNNPQPPSAYFDFFEVMP